ncbi:MAG: hypothetical protein HZA60_00265 [Deltaproteobacteria bacterium]|nr:hypothetical protein [Deltaproteobacteria bacterium]
MGSLKLLVLTYRYAPALHPRAFRWSSIAEYWACKGHRVDVVTVRTPGVPREGERNGVQVHRVGGAILERLKHRLGREAASPASPGRETLRGGGGAGPASGLASVAHWMSDRTWKKVRWPDYAATWYFPAVKAARRLLATGGYDGFLSVSDPFTAHMAGLRLKKDFGTLRWIADIGDPFCFQDVTPVNNPSLYKRLNFRAEQNVFSLADTVAVTNRPTFEKYAALFPRAASKIRVIPPLLSIEDRGPGRDRVFPEDAGIRLVFIGTLYRAVRSPEYLLRLFEGLLKTNLGDRLSLHFVGNINDCREFFLPYAGMLGRKIFLHGMVDRPTVFRAMSEASCLVHIGNATAYQLPSKVVEYAGSGKPVINLVQSADDCSAEFFGAYPASLRLMENEGPPARETIDKLARFIQRAQGVAPESLADFLSAYRVEAIASAYEEIFSVPPGRGAPRAIEEEPSR